MDYKFTVRGFDSSPAVEQYLAKRLEKVDRVLRDSDVVSAEIKAEKDAVNYVLKANINLRGTIVVVQEKDPDLYAAIDKMSDALEKKIKKTKSTIREKHRTPVEKMPEMAVAPLEEESDISETKRIPLSIMPLEEAMLQFKTMKRQFFVFRNSDTNEINMLYTRKDGKIGLFEFVD
ncbi:ribosome hibernation-promoting factor, HPF/YfiA family [Thermotoga profunda]|uniref:ribosome hibernation-promoting factor, HPF/YfiA family n=1 Tax=Thermotoga profunda TaxID=1508420 RepID=UPI00059787FD|nr:ribosome-associated translation inhibitor RaiA [Thermotoga profunda]